MMKAVGGEPKSIEGVTYDTKAKIGTWKGKITFSVIPMDDYKIVLGLAFFDRSNAIPDAFLNTLYLIKDKEVHTAPMETDTRHRGKTLSTMQIVRTKQQPRKQHDEGVVNLGGGECHDPPKYRILKPLSREAVFGVFSKVEDNGRYLDIYELYCMFEHTVYGRELIQRGKPMIFRKYIRSFPGLHLFEERHKRNSKWNVEGEATTYHCKRPKLTACVDFLMGSSSDRGKIRLAGQNMRTREGSPYIYIFF
ncbi:uncharacterized protein LOC110905011 isoform X3 [Helianthus annuus]|uniref:uncharacterized protein LOC110905011 isoform X3 n=1 Tax=Helianthus annuus TaxID=4232 RepID=UPI000B906BB2|nr:uncharacterized protein LOC110905011 isoform X3 [Helianthus annuus]